jgi:hypothetical protein
LCTGSYRFGYVVRQGNWVLKLHWSLPKALSVGVLQAECEGEEARAMWFSLFSIALAAAICLSVASFMMQQAKPRSN